MNSQVTRRSSREGSIAGLHHAGDIPQRIEDLPLPETKRWVIRRKAQVVAGVRSGLITLEDACRRYKLSIEEFLSWQRMIDSHGMRGLRVTRLQDYRAQRPAATEPHACLDRAPGAFRHVFPRFSASGKFCPEPGKSCRLLTQSSPGPPSFDPDGAAKT
jgi:hypothetical protein